MKKTLFTLSLAASAVLADSYTLDQISVSGKSEQDGVTTKNINKEDIEKRVGAGQTNPLKALDMLPSIQTGQADTYGLVTEDNPLRVRGAFMNTFNNFALTVDGVPSVVIVQKAAIGNLLDMENMESMSLTVGASPADSGFGFGNATGSLDMQTKKASSVMSFLGKQSFGSENFSRTFVRADSGKLGSSGIRFFVSASDSRVDKWKGPGNAERQNVEFGVIAPIGDNVTVDALVAYNHIKKHDYRALSYAEASDLGTNYELDFSEDRTSKYYYDYNKQDFEGYMAQANLEAKLLGGKLSVKPYYITTSGEKYSFNTSGNLVTKVNLEQEQYGLITRFDKKIADTDMAIGYWYQSIESSPPPLLQKNYRIVNGQLTLNNAAITSPQAGYGMLNKVETRETHSPFVAIKQQVDKLKVEAGLRYVDYHLPKIQGYTLAYTAGDFDYDTAISKATIDPTMKVDESHFRVWLPSLSAKYALSSNADVFVSYAKGVASPDQGPLWQTYKSNKATFAAKGITLQDFWNRAKFETSDQYNTGVKYRGKNYSVEPTLYYAKYKDKQVSAYDSLVNLTYKQNAAEMEARGFELSGTYSPIDEIELFAAASYNDMRFTKDMSTTGGATISVIGKQAPDAPKKMLKAGATFKYKEFYATPNIKYMSERYGDAENTQRIAPYAVADMSIGYAKKNKSGTFKEISGSLDLQNILGRKYISLIQASDDATAGTSMQYVQGAPFAAIATLALKF